MDPIECLACEGTGMRYVEGDGSTPASPIWILERCETHILVGQKAS